MRTIERVGGGIDLVIPYDERERITVMNRDNFCGALIRVNRPDMRCRLTPQVVEWLEENNIPFEQNSIRHKKRAASVRVRFETLFDAMQFKMRWC